MINDIKYPYISFQLMKNKEDFMDNKYAVGDIVKLNAGGPDMSVLDVEKKIPGLYV